MKKTLPVFLLFLFSAELSSQTPTWSEDVACIVYSHCSSCHNSNGIAPFPLISYNDAFTHRFNISASVTDKAMPPYLPNTSFQHYADENILTTQEINTIAEWVNGGAPEGNPASAPAPPVYSSAEVITNPDLVGKMQPYTIPAMSGSDLYRCFVLTNPQPATQNISSIEVIPGNRAIVHHVLIFQDTSSTPVMLDNNDPGEGYTSFGGIGSNSAKLIGGWVPGSSVFEFPSGMGMQLNAGARIIIQVHYPVGTTGQTDSTKVNIKFTTQPGVRNVSIQPILNHIPAPFPGSLQDGPLFIPANTVKTFHSQFTLPLHASLLGVAPHAHLVCTKMKTYGVTTSGDTLPFIDIPQWDFQWQGSHPFQRIIKVPAGTVLYGEATYDNTANNPNNPNNPPQDVSVGEATSDEMMLFYFTYLLYQNGDEDIIIDTSSHKAHYLDCVSDFVSGVNDLNVMAEIALLPNPAYSQVIFIASEIMEEIKLFDALGSLVYFNKPESLTSTIEVGNLSAGIYAATIVCGNGNSTRKLVIQK